MIGISRSIDPGATASPALARALPVVLLGLAACGGGDVALPDLAPVAAGDSAELVRRGEYLVRSVAVCGHCHAADPSEPDGPLSGGMAFENWRLGLIRAANLTPDAATGLGRWTDAEIVRAIRTGEDREGDLIAPIMPYAWFNGMSGRDALAIVRYLKSLAPVRNEVENEPNLIYEAAKAFILEPEDEPGRQIAPVRAATPEYGRYLAHHVALCVDCHTPRGGIQAKPDLDRLFAGDSDPPAGFPANPANITPDDETGIGRWSEADFISTLRTGVNPAGDTLHPFMPWREYRHMTDDDLSAIYQYLRTVEPIRNEVRRRP